MKREDADIFTEEIVSIDDCECQEDCDEKAYSAVDNRNLISMALGTYAVWLFDSYSVVE